MTKDAYFAGKKNKNSQKSNIRLERNNTTFGKETNLSVVDAQEREGLTKTTEVLLSFEDLLSFKPTLRPK